jgi:CRP/FNR family transcriptional regulator
LLEEKLNFLRRSSIFSQFADEELKKIAELIIERKLKKGSVVFYEHDPSSAFYIIKEGKVKVYKMSEDGRELIIGIFSSGGIFGDVPVFDGGPYPATAATLTDSVLYLIRKEQFEELLTRHPEISLKVIRILGRRLRQALNLIKNLGLKNVPQRLAGLLLQLAKEYSHKSEAGMELDIPLSRQELAELIGVSRETVIRELGKFAKAKIIKIEGKKIFITNQDKLRLWSKT